MAAHYAARGRSGGVSQRAALRRPCPGGTRAGARLSPSLRRGCSRVTARGIDRPLGNQGDRRTRLLEPAALGARPIEQARGLDVQLALATRTGGRGDREHPGFVDGEATVLAVEVRHGLSPSRIRSARSGPHPFTGVAVPAGTVRLYSAPRLCPRPADGTSRNANWEAQFSDIASKRRGATAPLRSFRRSPAARAPRRG